MNTPDEATKRRIAAQEAVDKDKRVLAASEAELVEALYAEVAALAAPKKRIRKKGGTP